MTVKKMWAYLETYLEKTALDVYVTAKRLKSDKIWLRMAGWDNPRNFISFIRELIIGSDPIEIIPINKIKP